MWRRQNVLQRFQHVLKWRRLQPREKITQNAFLILFTLLLFLALICKVTFIAYNSGVSIIARFS